MQNLRSRYARYDRGPQPAPPDFSAEKLGSWRASWGWRYPRRTVPTIVRRAAPKAPPVSLPLIRAWGNAMLARVERGDAELSVLLTNDRNIQRLNRDFRGKDRPTDVLSFEIGTGMGTGVAEGEWLLGDIAISLETAARQAQGRKRPLELEIRWLLAHGILHLCGYDHATAAEKRVMVAWTRRLVRAADAIRHLSRTGTRARPLVRPRKGTSGAPNSRSGAQERRIRRARAAKARKK